MGRDGIAMYVSLPYGRTEMGLTIPAGLDVEVLRPLWRDSAAPGLEEVALALDHPVGRGHGRGYGQEQGWGPEALAAACRRAGRGPGSRTTTVAIAVSDPTRPVPSSVVLRPLMARLEACGFEPNQVTIIMGCGIHRPPREEEARSILNPECLDGTRFLIHSAGKGETVFLGTTSRGTPVNVSRDFVRADLRIVTGMIEPHQFAGFSGGAKAAVIGLGNEATIHHNHSLLVHEGARPGALEGNPVREDIEEAARLVGIHFVVNVVMAPRARVLKAFAGAYPEAYREGAEFARRLFSVSFRSQCDVVVVSCGGYPKDINLYQAQKALAHVEAMVRTGGAIVLVAECPEGTGDEQFQDWMRRAVSAGVALDYFRDRGFQLGAHKAYLVARTMMKAALFLVSSLPGGVAGDMGFEPFEDAGEALDAALTRLGRATRIGVVPHGTGMILSSGG